MQKLKVPLYTIVLRKAYGLGAMAMAGGSFSKPNFIISWPTGEFGPMGLEGAVRLGYKKELEAQSDEESKVKLFNQLVDAAYHKGRAQNAAFALEFDEVIDPRDARKWISKGLNAYMYH